VTFNGVTAQIEATLPSAVATRVPEMAAGPATITVTVGTKTASFSGFIVLGPAPVVGSVSPNPVRAGETLIISGQNLRASQAGVVLIDGVAVVPLSGTNTEIQVQVPIQVTPGNHVLRVQVEAELSNTVSFQVEIFTVTGTYVSQGPIVLNSCGVGDPVGTVNTFEIAMIDNRPILTGRIGAIPLQGTMTGGGSFNMSQIEGDFTERLEGTMIATPQGDVGFSARSTTSISSLACSVVWDIIGARFTTVATSRVPSANFLSDTEASLGRGEALRNLTASKMQ
jgi:hypothetical protein